VCILGGIMCSDISDINIQGPIEISSSSAQNVR